MDYFILFDFVRFPFGLSISCKGSAKFVRRVDGREREVGIDSGSFSSIGRDDVGIVAARNF